jgi:hypothetical protein
MGVIMKNEWVTVSFSSGCDEDGNCGICGVDYAECECPGPTMEDYEYKFDEGGLMWARRIKDDTSTN